VIRVAIVAVSPVVRAGLESLVVSGAGMTLAGAFAGTQALEALRPDVLLVAGDEPPEFDGVPVVLLASEPDPLFTAERFQAGVRAVLAPNASPAAIIAALDAAAAGLAVIEPQELHTLLPARVESASLNEGDSALTPREMEVLRMMAEGAANKAIAWKLGISEHTVKFHVASILSKLRAGTRTEAVTIGIRKGLVMI
jgi:NarL family two-component system response regulator YdfI